MSLTPEYLKTRYKLLVLKCAPSQELAEKGLEIFNAYVDKNWPIIESGWNALTPYNQERREFVIMSTIMDCIEAKIKEIRQTA